MDLLACVSLRTIDEKKSSALEADLNLEDVNVSHHHYRRVIRTNASHLKPFTTYCYVFFPNYYSLVNQNGAL